MWTIDWLYHLLVNLPNERRTAIRIEWLDTFNKGLKDIETLFKAYRELANRKATYNGQIMVLERLLNLNYYSQDIWASPGNPTANGHIWIERTGITVPSTFIFNEIEQQPPVYVYNWVEGGPNLFVFNSSEYQVQIAFKVRVPAALVFNQDEMRARIDKYIIAGYNYEIQTY